MKAITRDFTREVRNTRSRFLSILILVALAVAFLSGLRSTAPDMKATCDAYMDGHQVMDIQILSTLGLTEEDLQTLLMEDGISGGEGAYVIDAFASSAELDIVVKAYSLPQQLNLLQLDQGRLPRSEDECAVDRNILDILGLDIGDSLSLKTEGDYKDALLRRSFTIVGVVTSPLYISVERGASTLGTGKVSAYLYLPREAFDMDYYTAIYLQVEGAEAETAFYDGYETKVDGVIDNLEPLADQRAVLRREGLVDEANDKLSEAQQELDDAKEEAQEELDDAWAELVSGRRELNDGWGELRRAKATLADETADAQRQIDDAKSDLTDAQIKLDDGEQEYAEGYFAYEDAIEDYNDGVAEYEDGLADYEEGLAEYAKGKKELDDAWAELSAGGDALSDAKHLLATSQAQFDALMEALVPLVSQATGMAFESGDELLAAMADEEEGFVLCAAVDNVLSQIYGLTSLSSAELLALAAGGDGAQAYLAASMVLGGVNSALAEQGMYFSDAGELLAAMADPQTGPVVCAVVDAVMPKIHESFTDADSGGPIGSEYLLDAKHQLDSGRDRYESGVEEFQAGEAQYLAGKKKLEESWAQLEDAKAQLDDAKKQLDEGAEELDDAKAALISARMDLDNGWEEFEDGLQEVADAEQELAEQVADANAEIADAQRELMSGEADYNDGLAKYYDGKAEAEDKIADAQRELADARRKVADIGTCEWYVLSRDSNPGYLGFGQDADRMGNLASVFPLLFFLVAALVCLTTMTRMVEDQRTQIGCLKALGYGRMAISRKYLGYGLLPALIGGILGLVMGYTLFPKMIFTAYQIMYQMPDILLRQYPSISVFSLLSAVACTSLASCAACLSTLALTPANLMRPKSPKPGKRVILEYIRPLWRRMSFQRKVTARNLLRYKKRFFMTVIGIGGCTALIIAGFGLRSSLMVTMNRQYQDIYHYTAQAALAGNVLEEEKADIDRYLGAEADIVDFMPCRLGNATAESSVYSTTAYVEVVDPEEIAGFVELRDYRTGEPLQVPEDGVIIDQKLSELLHVGVGDSFTLDGDSRATVTVRAVNEHYLAHFVYMTPAYYEEVFRQSYAENAYLLTFTEDTEQLCDRIFSDLMSLHGVASVSRIAETRNTYLHSMERIDFVVVIVILSAAALALVVLYNLSNINITERKRELATIKVLGFFDREVSAYVNRENVVLTAAGIGLGILSGHYLHTWLVKSVEIDLMMFGRETDPMAYLWAAVLTAGFSILVNLMSHRKMKKIDMVESLKSAE
ncbi:ABC transporter permease [Oscillibacter sp. MSJ-2]|uniref:ABC transporter permease n=1 Tax=Dysosmobacter acutus TaxID=2841504 RepID=A0ABS6F963_9FIRM|nr:ABC transporter permease [Dysosmobacter acutus]